MPMARYVTLVITSVTYRQDRRRRHCLVDEIVQSLVAFLYV
jgi:hypothetical protein